MVGIDGEHDTTQGHFASEMAPPAGFEPATIRLEVRSGHFGVCQTTSESEEGRTLRAAQTNPVLMPAGQLTTGLDHVSWATATCEA